MEKTGMLLNSLSLSEMFFNNYHTAIAILDRDFNFLRVNELYAKADNRLVTDFPGHNHFEFYPGDEVKSIFENVIRTKQTFQIFARPFVYASNPERGITYWDWTLVPVLDSSGEVEILIFTLVNVTEQKRKEIELERFFELSYDLLCVVNYDYGIKRVNHAFTKNFGYAKDELIGTKVTDYIYPEDKATLYKEFDKLINLKIPITFTNRILCKDASYKWIEWTHTPIPEEQVFYIVGRDITERKRLEDGNKLNQQRLEALVRMNNMYDATVKQIGEFALEEMVKLTGSEFGWLGFLNAEETLVSTIAYSKNMILKCEMVDNNRKYSVNNGGLWAEAIRQRRAVIINEYTAGNVVMNGLPVGDIPLKRVLNVPIFEGKHIVMQAVVANKTEEYNQSDVKQLTLLIKNFWTLIQRKNAEDKLLVSEDRFRNLFENSMDGIFLTKQDGTIISANPSLCQMLGMSEQEICQIGRNGVIDLADPRLNELLSERQQTGQSKGELNFLHKDGSIVPVEITSKIFKTSDGEHFTSMFVRDISERIKTQQEMSRLDRLNIIGQMAAGIGHEVRNPMTIVRGFLQMLSNKPKNRDDSEYFNLMISELDRANAIITEFLSLARNTPVELQLHNFNQMIEELFPLLQADALNADKNLEIEMQPLPNINVNKNEIYQLILNLVRNGLDAMQTGGCVTIKTFIEGENMILAIKDEGSGIDPSILDKLGTPFITTKDNGTGLGLATCFSIAKRHNARIDVDTSAKGTTFFVRFKITP